MKDVRQTQSTLIVFALIGVLFLSLYSFLGGSKVATPGVSATAGTLGLFGALALVGSASFTLGGALGFLFGIPKSNNEPTPPAAETPAPTAEVLPERRPFRSNTNLEEMSDSLTKFIVGAGLVGLKDLVRGFDTLVTRTAEGLDGAPFATMVVGADIIGYAVLGFFSTYLITRLYLAGAFTRAEAQLEIQKKVERVADLRMDDLSPIEKEMLKKVIDARGKNTAFVLPPDFKRDSDDHIALRSLRSRGLVRPKEDGPWRPGTTAILTPLGEAIDSRLQAAVE